jgi:hypothetical protein
LYNIYQHKPADIVVLFILLQLVNIPGSNNSQSLGKALFCSLGRNRAPRTIAKTIRIRQEKSPTNMLRKKKKYEAMWNRRLKEKHLKMI